MTLQIAAFAVGTTQTGVVVDKLTRTQIVMYAGASGDFNPIHTDEVYATQAAGHPTVFAHGMLSMAATGKVLTDWVGVARLRKFGARFVAQVWPGDTLTATATVERVYSEAGVRFADFAVTTVNQTGSTVLSGYATARIYP